MGEVIISEALNKTENGMCIFFGGCVFAYFTENMQVLYLLQCLSFH